MPACGAGADGGGGRRTDHAVAEMLTVTTRSTPLLLVRVLTTGRIRASARPGWWSAAIWRLRSACCMMPPVMPRLHIETFRATIMIMGRFGQIWPTLTHDHETARAEGCSSRGMPAGSSHGQRTRCGGHGGVGGSPRGLSISVTASLAAHSIVLATICGRGRCGI
jgi:hypothetical protein